MLKTISFFSGAGGLDLGLINAGLDIKLCVELEKKYCKTLQLNHPNLNIANEDIMTLNKEKIYKLANININREIDFIVGGSPCQSFSTIGKRQCFDDPRGQAMLKYIDLIQEIKPKAFLLENVKGLLSASIKPKDKIIESDDFEYKKGSALEFFLSKTKGYNVTYKVINAANYGVAQKRERVFFIGIREDLNKTFEFPKETHSEKGENDTLKWIDIQTIFKDLENIEHHYINYSESRLNYMKLIPKGGGNWRDLPQDIQKEAMGGSYNSEGGKVGFYRRLKLDKPSPTLLTSPTQRSTNLGHPLEDRPLSIEEYKIIQGFSLNYKINGTIREQYTQIGNAVPVQLGYILGKEIINLLLK